MMMYRCKSSDQLHYLALLTVRSFSLALPVRPGYFKSLHRFITFFFLLSDVFGRVDCRCPVEEEAMYDEMTSS